MSHNLYKNKMLSFFNKFRCR